MIKTTIKIGILSGVMMFNACGSSEEHAEEQNHTAKEQQVAKECHYTLNKSSVELEWTSFKHTAKTPVKGTFNTIEIQTAEEQVSNPVELLKGAYVKISTASVNSGNEGRDEKLKNSFFNTMNNGEFLAGEVRSVDGEKEGIAVIAIKMNGAEKEQKFAWKIDENNKLILKTEISVDNWNASSSLDALHKVCEEKHTGEDGVSKLWPNVELNISAQIDKICE